MNKTTTSDLNTDTKFSLIPGSIRLTVHVVNGGNCLKVTCIEWVSFGSGTNTYHSSVSSEFLPLLLFSPTRGRMVEEQRHMEEKDAIRQKSAER